MTKFTSSEEYQAWKAARLSGPGVEAGSESSQSPELLDGVETPPHLSGSPPTEQVATNASQRARRRWPYLLAIPLLAALIVWTLNHALLDLPVASALGADSRNAGYSISAHYRFYLEPSTLILDLTSASAASPLDLFRGLFQSAAVLAGKGRRFESVVLERSGTPIFQMKGDEFASLGLEFQNGQNPVYLIRTLPEKLYKPTGEAAFGHWEGGLLGVLRKQMEDANEAGRRWGLGQ